MNSHSTRDWYQYFQEVDINNLPFFLYSYYQNRKPSVSRILRHLPEHGSIVELGCGTGLMMTLLSSMGYRAIGLDSDSRVVEMARDLNSRLGGHAEFLQMDLFNAATLGEFDLAYSEGVIEHYQGQLLDDSIQVHRKLGKRVLIVVPCSNVNDSPDQENYSYGKLAKVCKRNGLRPIDRYPIGPGKWATILLPPFLLSPMSGRLLSCLDVGMVFERD